jgi:hypothetical protein
MTKRKPSSETMATAFLTVLSLVGGLAVACTAGVGVRPVSDVNAQPPAQVVTPTPAPSAPPPEPAVPLDSPRLRFPADAVVDVKVQYGAAGNGTTDDTVAIQKAIRDNPGRTLYLPSGTYLVSRSLEGRGQDGGQRAGLRMVGEERATTILKLKDKASGFNDRWNPRPLLRTGTAPVTAGTGPGRPDTDMGFGNLLDNFTVDTGANTGAVGIDYTGSNVAALRRITVTGKGTTGVSATRAFPGPALLSRVVVRGFDYGIRVGQGQYGLTLEHITLSGQRIAGLENAGNILAIRGLTSENTVPAIRSQERFGFVTLVDAKLTGGIADFSAIQSSGELMLRRVTTVGYRSALTQLGKIIPGPEINQYVSKAPLALFPDVPSRAGDLPVRDTPEYFSSNPADWLSVAAAGAKADDDVDDTAAIQKALDAGKPVVYLPPGRYVISATLHVKGAVRQVAGMGATTLVPAGAAFGNADQPAALFAVENGNAPDVTITGLTVGKGKQASPGLIGVVQHTARPLVLKDVACCGDYKWGFHAQAGAGPLYLDNVSASRFQLDQPQPVWARQFNHEDTDVRNRAPRVVNAGATLWVLGFETEQNGPLLRTERGGRTEILGGAVYETNSVDDVAFEAIDDGSMALSFATMGPGNGTYDVLVRQRRAGTSKDLVRLKAAWRGEGRTVALYTG